MAKYLLIIGAIFFFVLGAQAQYSTSINNNPFKNLQFLNSATDTITFSVSYNNIIGNISDNNLDMIAVIQQNTGEKVKRLNYAIGFTIPGYPQKFYAPCKDEALFATLSSKKNTISKLKLSCVVYRFYYLDSACNFFYIDKGTIVN